ncbi:MAG: O-antigen ligase family protein [Planctomycetota bacterium]
MKQTLFLVAILAGAIPVTLVNPFVGLLVYYAFATLYPQHLWDHALPPGIRWSLLIGVPTLIGFVAHGFARSRAGARWPMEKKLMAVLAVLIGLSMVDAIDPTLAGRQLYYLAVIFTMFFVGCALIDSRYRLHALAILLVGTLGWVAFDFNQRYVLMDQTHILMRGFGDLDNNGAATLMVMGMPFCVFLVTQERQWYFKAVALGALALMLHMVLFSMSRAAMLACLIMLPLLLLRLRDRRLGVGLLAVTIVLAVVLAGREVRARFMSIADYQTDTSAQIRLDAWKTGWQVIQDYPVLGVGPDCFRRVVGDYAFELKGRTMHNRFIQTAVDMGLPAALALVGALLTALWHLERLRRRHRDDPFVFNLATCLQSCLIGYILAGMFVSIGTVELPYIALAMVVGLRNIVAEEKLAFAVEPSAGRRRRARRQLQAVRPVPV